MNEPPMFDQDAIKAYNEALSLTGDAQAASLLLISFRLFGIEHQLGEIGRMLQEEIALALSKD